MLRKLMIAAAAIALMAGTASAQFLHIGRQHHIAARRGDQQRRHAHVRQIGVNVIGMETFEARQHGAFIARDAKILRNRRGIRVNVLM